MTGPVTTCAFRQRPLDLGRQHSQVVSQTAEQLLLRWIRRKVADQPALGAVGQKLLKRAAVSFRLPSLIRRPQAWRCQPLRKVRGYFVLPCLAKHGLAVGTRRQPPGGLPQFLRLGGQAIFERLRLSDATTSLHGFPLLCERNARASGQVFSHRPNIHASKKIGVTRRKKSAHEF
jgi:hypothetical protein